MKPLPMALLALGIATTAQAAGPKAAAEWYIYAPSTQVCNYGGTPAKMMAAMRKIYKTDPETEDTTDGDGKVTAVQITIWNMYNQTTMALNIFRAKADCEDFAKERRTDTKRYD